jgi:hypothetical protein
MEDTMRFAEARILNVILRFGGLGLVVVSGVAAAATKEAMREFGLTGTYSEDCSKRPGDPLSQGAITPPYSVVSRIRWEAPLLGEAKRVGLSPNGFEFEWIVEAAEMASNDKIHLTLRSNSCDFAGRCEHKGETHEEVLQKIGTEKYRIWLSRNGASITIEDGRRVSTNEPLPSMEKCRS